MPISSVTSPELFMLKNAVMKLDFFGRGPSRCVWSAIYYISAVDTQHIKSVALLQLVTFGYMFRPSPGHHQANKEKCC